MLNGVYIGMIDGNVTDNGGFVVEIELSTIYGYMGFRLVNNMVCVELDLKLTFTGPYRGDHKLCDFI